MRNVTLRDAGGGHPERGRFKSGAGGIKPVMAVCPKLVSRTLVKGANLLNKLIASTAIY